MGTRHSNNQMAGKRANAVGVKVNQLGRKEEATRGKLWEAQDKFPIQRRNI